MVFGVAGEQGQLMFQGGGGDEGIAQLQVAG